MNRIYFNFWHIKDKNGMFYFLLDYKTLLSNDFECIIVTRRGRFHPSDFSQTSCVLELGVTGYITFCFCAIFRKINIFSASIHAIPFIENQVVTFHDSYPFRSSFKKFILFFMIKLSRCKIGTINESANVEFLQKLRLRYDFVLPNVLPQIRANIQSHKFSLRSGNLRVGLCGSDSKKNYHKFFAQIDNTIDRGENNGRELTVMLFGIRTPYISHVMDRERNFQLKFFDSRDKSLSEFLMEDIDVLVSVARNEGFGRPIALAVLMQKPVLLLDDIVFREFYDGHACFYGSISDLVFGLYNSKPAVFGSAIEFELKNEQKVKTAVTNLKKTFNQS